MLAFSMGEVSAFEALVQRHRGPVFNFIFRSTGQAARAEDLLQETWLKVIRGAPDYEPRARFTTWLYTIARNLCVDSARTQILREALSLDSPIRRDGVEQPSANTPPDGPPPPPR